MEAEPIQKSCTGEAPEPSRTLGSKKLFNFPHAPKSAMFSSCIYCGRIHAEGYICSKKPIKRKKLDDAVRFRTSSEWNRKRLEIRAQDNYLWRGARAGNSRTELSCCQKLFSRDVAACFIRRRKSLSISLILVWVLSCAATHLCSMHHAMCDRGEIPYDEVRKIISEQEKSSCFRLRHPPGIQHEARCRAENRQPS